MKSTQPIWFTSDTHFGHKSLIADGNRHLKGSFFSSIEQHDEMLIERWNSKIAKNEDVFHLGDFAWVTPAIYRARLNGHIHLIEGNHDRIKTSEKKLFVSIDKVKYLKVDDQQIFMSHYAHRVWNGSHHGTFHLYGHSHGNLADDPHALSLDVGVDCWDFYPVSYAEIVERLANKTFKPVDHHE